MALARGHSELLPWPYLGVVSTPSPAGVEGIVL